MCRYIIPEICCARKEIGIAAPKPVFVIQIIVRKLDRLNTSPISLTYVYYIYDHEKVSLIAEDIFLGREES